jgi:hypothetical protein
MALMNVAYSDALNQVFVTWQRLVTLNSVTVYYNPKESFQQSNLV